MPFIHTLRKKVSVECRLWTTDQLNILEICVSQKPAKLGVGGLKNVRDGILIIQCRLQTKNKWQSRWNVDNADRNHVEMIEWKIKPHSHSSSFLVIYFNLFNKGRVICNICVYNHPSSYLPLRSFYCSKA